MALDPWGEYKPRGSALWMRHESAAFARTCPFSPAARNEDQLAASLFPKAEVHHPACGRFREAYVGHVGEADFRAQGSSGGMVTWMLVELMRRGMIDGAAHVRAADPQVDGRFFKYTLSRSEAELRGGAKSRYFPVEMSEMLAAIRKTPGRYAIVGVPCFIKAVQLLREEDPVIKERVAFTLGLFCGHMKSARMVESFAWQMGVRIEDVQAVEFRIKDPTRPASTYTAEFTLHDGSKVKRDWWNLVDGDWGSGFFQYEACNYCDDVVGETADVSFGDAWVEPYASDGRGTNVVIVRSEKVSHIVKEAINEGRLNLEPVNGDFVARTQAAGLRQRRQGLAYRLTWRRRGIRPRKRVEPDSNIPSERKRIYRTRARITAWSRRMFGVARALRWPGLFIVWGRMAVTYYHAVAYSRGRLGGLLARLGMVPRT